MDDEGRVPDHIRFPIVPCQIDDYNLPLGLKNIGNTCYFASLIQILFHLPNVTNKILSFNTSQFDKHWEKIKESKEIDMVD